MADDDEEVMNWLSEVGAEPLRPEPRAFSPEQMVRCEVCLRANPPTRTGCLYCAAQLPVTEASAHFLRQPTLRKPGIRESGFNLILSPDGSHEGLTEDSLAKMAELLRLEIEELLRILESGEPLPLTRAATHDEASVLESRLRALGANVFTVADQDLALDECEPKRLRSIVLGDDALVAHPFGSEEGWETAWTEISLLVAGRLFARRVEVEERRGHGAENEIVEARELSADEAVMDVYVTGRDGNARILAHRFDFSCLGQQMSLLAAENFSKLALLLRERAARAQYDDSYNRLRHALNAAWPLEEQTGSGGLRRARPGRLNTETVTTSDNERQFTRYSRLRHYLKSRYRDSLR
ncbi:MAG TPA: hypothetical protein VGX92_03830 [Pyrinomonadaceae bacterium]|nr:hypothetical protein [Pyrinomonadaceae bacterium]